MNRCESVVGPRTPRSDRDRRFDKRFDAAVAVAGLPRKQTTAIGRVLHEHRIDRSEAHRIGRQRVAAMGLVDRHFPAVPHVEESLLGMHVGTGGDPGRRVESRRAMAAVDVFPVDHQRDGVFGRDSATARQAGRRRSVDGDRPRKRGRGPNSEVNVMRIEIVADITRLSGPAFEAYRAGSWAGSCTTETG